MIVQFCQKIIGIQINLKHVVVLSKDKVFIYDLAGMTFVHRLNLEFHLGRVILAANASMDRPLLLYSNSADRGSLKVFNIGNKRITKSISCHKTAILHMNCDLGANYAVTYSGGSDAIRLWNLNTGVKIASYLLGSCTEFSSLFLGQAG